MRWNPSDFREERRPVDSISWNDAASFCATLTDRERAAGRLPGGYVYTLPTEAQWEYACRANAATRSAEEVGWVATNSGEWTATDGWRMGTHAAGEKPPNAWGFFDMRGNVAEWCADFYAPLPTGTVADDYAGPPTGVARVLRGGCWWADAQNCSPGSRHRGPPGRWHSALGMRVAMVKLP